jgi:hypothetical protein
MSRIVSWASVIGTTVPTSRLMLLRMMKFIISRISSSVRITVPRMSICSTKNPEEVCLHDGAGRDAADNEHPAALHRLETVGPGDSAEIVDDGIYAPRQGVAMIGVTKLMQPDGLPWPEPKFFGLFYVTIDSANKTGASADGTARSIARLSDSVRTIGSFISSNYNIVQVTAGVLDPAEAAVEVIG